VLTARIGAGLSSRDLDVLRLVARLKRVPSNHLYELAFTSTRPTMYTVLDRLVANHYLRRSERRFVGDADGGSGQYVYALGRAGWATFFPDEPYRGGAVLNRETLHTLAVADCYLDIIRLQRAHGRAARDADRTGLPPAVRRREAGAGHVYRPAHANN
jgi:hypothetical protein